MVKHNFWDKYGIWILLFIGFLLGAYRLRYFVGNEIPLGYDPGMYKGIFIEYGKVLWNFDFSLLPGWVRHEPLLGIIMGSIGKFGANFDWRLTRGIGIINLIPGILIFVLLKKENKLYGLIAAWLYWLSIAGYQVFWRGYFKQIIAVNLMLLILIVLQQKKLIWQWILFFILIILHKHTALYTGAILVGYTILERYKSKKIPRKEIGIWVSAGIIALIVYIPIWQQIMPEAIKAVGNTFAGNGTGGDFIDRLQYLRFERLIILLSIFGISWKLRKKKFDIFVVGYIIGAIWLLVGFVNFNRTIVFFDIFVVIFAAYCLWNIYIYKKQFGLFILGIIVLATGINYFIHINIIAKPLISKEEFLIINKLNEITEKNAIIITSHRNYTPWIMGRSQRDYINPGMAELDKWNHSERNKRRENNGNYKCQMLEKSYKNLNRPLYLWIGEQQSRENLYGGDCLHLYKIKDSWKMWKIEF